MRSRWNCPNVSIHFLRNAHTAPQMTVIIVQTIFFFQQFFEKMKGRQRPWSVCWCCMFHVVTWSSSNKQTTTDDWPFRPSLHHHLRVFHNSFQMPAGMFIDFRESGWWAPSSADQWPSLCKFLFKFHKIPMLSVSNLKSSSNSTQLRRFKLTSPRSFGLPVSTADYSAPLQVS